MNLPILRDPRSPRRTMSERPTEPYPDPADPSARTPEGQTPGTDPAATAAPTPVTPARITTTSGPTPAPAASPAAAGRPVARADPGRTGGAGATPAAAPAGAFSPAPERVDRDRVTWQTTAQPTPESWFEPSAAAATTAAVPAAAVREPRRSAGILGPGPRRLAHRGRPRLRRHLPDAARQRARSTSRRRPPRFRRARSRRRPQPIKIDESSAIIAVAAKVSPAVVRIVSSANATRPTRRRSRPRASAPGSSTTRTAGS